MSALITLDSVSAAAPDGRLLFDNLTLAIGAERIGANVAGSGIGDDEIWLQLAAGKEAVLLQRREAEMPGGAQNGDLDHVVRPFRS